MVFVEIKSSISSQSDKKVTILRNVLDSPKSGLLSCISKSSISRSWIESSQIKKTILALKSSSSKFIHDNIFSIELNPTNSIA